MNRFILNSIRINGSQLLFSEGMNFIVGSNGSGKTTLYNLIMYALGLRDLKRTLDTLYPNEIIVNCYFGNLQVNITRYRDNLIHFDGDINNEARYGSLELYFIYNSLLCPVFDFGEDIQAGQEILRSSFFSDERIFSEILLAQLNKKILGINVDYIKTYKQQINLFKQEIRNDQYVHDTLKTYINNVEGEIEGILNKEIFSGILKKQYLNMYDKLFQNRRLLDEAIELYEVSKKNHDSIYKERNEVIELNEDRFFNKLGIYRGESIKDYSGGHKRLRKFIPTIARTIKYPENNYINSSGILIADTPLVMLDSKSVNLLRGLLLEECQNQRLQYIEFVHHDADIPSSSNVIHLNSKEVIGWLRVN